MVGVVMMGMSGTAVSDSVAVSLESGSLLCPGNVTVGTRPRVAVGAAVPSGVGEESGVAKMLGVGVGGFSSSAGRVGAIWALT